MGETEKNLKKAFQGESQAYLKYLAYARRAADEYREGVYKLFQAVAESEKIHARRHLGHLKAVRETERNLEEAMGGERAEFTSMYPDMAGKAKEEDEKGPEISFSQAAQVEELHHRMFERALADVENFPVQDYFVCDACGYVAEEEAPGTCPVCGAVKKAFYKVISQKHRQ